MSTDDEFLDALGAALEPPHREPPAERIAALRHAADARVTPTPQTHGRNPRRRWRQALPVLAATAAAALAFAAGAVVFSGDGSDNELLAGGVVEFDVTMRSPGGNQTATATGVRTGIGRTVRLRTDDLAILPTGELYELWFVGPGDAPGAPNRISAGTFHPDEQGRSRVDLTAAVDPARYPVITITAEPGDGDPSPTGPEVLRAAVGPDA